MDATSRTTLTWTPRRLGVSFAALTSAALIAGGTGGYLIHQSPAAPAAVHAATAPAAQGLNGDSGSGYAAGGHGAQPAQGLNGDSGSGY